ncbi:uncharacterized protein LOC128671528 [Plodia interpunctella]|uniref:uncharacterized protein LOC128671528 n=1 Tax=Plodia interpunctella TaxID=58824 RepID=UPI002368AC5D|nr:uncharacterized protein LOC128671528 [Plodia interpunctella]
MFAKMKVVVIIFIVCAAQTSASFFEEFRGAMHNVQHSFGRLLSDVYSDVSQTIGCTLLAVKQVLALDHSFHESSDYNHRCRGLSPAVTPQVPKTNKENLPYRYIDTINANDELGDIENKFKTETDRLLAISTLLKHEVDNIPNDIKIQFQFNSEPREPVDSIWQNLKILHDVEHSNKNYARASEIHQVLDKALNIMNIKTTEVNESDDDKIKTIVKDLEKNSKSELSEANDQFKEWKKDELKEKVETGNKNRKIVKVLNDSKDALIKADDQFKERKRDELNEGLVKDLKKDTKEVLIEAQEHLEEWKEEEKEVIESFIKNDQQTNESPPLIKTTDNIYTKIKNIEFNKKEDTSAAPPIKITTLSPEFEAFQNLILSQFGQMDDSKNAVDEATKLIQDSKYRNKVFDSVAKAESASRSDRAAAASKAAGPRRD